MNLWKITALYFGKATGPKSFLTPDLDPDLIMDLPYLGFLLQNGKENIVVDTGIHEDNIIDGLVLGAFPAEGGSQFVIDALKNEGLEISDIDKVIYTHLHYDHAGCAALFPNAKTYYQKEEYENLVNPLPTQQMRCDYDMRTIEDLATIKDVYVVDGDLILPNGLELYKVPGHSKGCMAIVVPTQEGRYILTSDIAHMGICFFPKTDKMELIGGEVVDITPAPDHIGPYLFNSFIYDHFAAYDSYNKLKALAEEFDPKWFLASHDTWVLNKKYFG